MPVPHQTNEFAKQGAKGRPSILVLEMPTRVLGSLIHEMGHQSMYIAARFAETGISAKSGMSEFGLHKRSE